jgi:hypothetical protein
MLYYVKVVLGDLTEQDCRDFAAAARAKVPVPGDDKGSVDAWAKDELLHDPAKLREILSRAKIDPYDHVRGVASELELSLPKAAP